MGVLAFHETHHRPTYPATPPELASPSASSSYSTRPSEDYLPSSHWHKSPVAPVSPPMSNHEHQQTTSAEQPSGARSDDGRGPSRLETSQPGPPRQQLPSLSSLFGPPASRQLPSPFSERPNAFPVTSPLDRPTERSASSSYFPYSASSSASSASQRGSIFDARFDDRPRSAHPSQPRTSFPGPLSPRSLEPEHGCGETRSEWGPSNRWPGAPDHRGSSEYSFVSREPPSFRSPHDRYPPPLPGYKLEADPRFSLDRKRPHPSGQPALPPALVNSAHVENIPTKDGLGPKIWTGTHFLPRFVRAAEVPGEGMCYFYDDGSHCKTVIDGEAVNAHWGVTKAGKPRKRLAIACITCREKKIKCDPDYPRCVQCEKFGRVCKFKNAPRGGSNTSPSTPPAEPVQPRRLWSLIRPPPESPRPGSNSSASASPRTAVRPASPPDSHAHGSSPKRIRLSDDHYAALPTSAPLSAEPRSALAAPPPPPLPLPLPRSLAEVAPSVKSEMASGLASWHHQHQHQHQHQPPHHQHHVPRLPKPELPRLRDDVLLRPWKADSYASDPQSVNSRSRSSPTST